MGSWKVWLHGLVAAVISAVASGVTLVIVDPNSFNLSKSGLGHLGAVCLIQGLIAAAAYLKQSPLPGDATKP